MAVILIVVALIGHVALAVWIVNRMHGLGINRQIQKFLDAAWSLGFFGGPLVLWFRFWRAYVSDGHALWSALWNSPGSGRPFQALAATYTFLCLIAAVWATLHRIYYALGPGRAYRAGTDVVRHVAIRGPGGRVPAGNLPAHMASHLPWNEVLNLTVTNKTLVLPQLHPALQGLSICHLSDLHLTGQWEPEFYHVVMEEAMHMQADMIAITGDIVEHRGCLPWIKPILGRLNAPLGVYFVLGNHEQRIKDTKLVRQTLVGAGLVDLGVETHIVDHDGCRLVLAGNELPWFPPDIDSLRNPAFADNVSALRIALSHAPDQLPWAQQHGIDLLLAGHTHGGQVRFPGFGPLLSPSLFGIQYASGVFYAPPTVMHVSRGISGTRPLRFRCPPEITRLTLVGEACAGEQEREYRPK